MNDAGFALIPNVLSHAFVRALAECLRPLANDAIPFRVTLFDKSQRSNWLVAWHQDTALPLRSSGQAGLPVLHYERRAPGIHLAIA